MKIAFVTLYDHCCPGARSLAGVLLEAGHDVSLMHFKRQITEFIPRGEEHKHPAIMHGYNVYGTEPAGNCYFPYPSVVQDSEIELFVDWVEKEAFDAVGFSLLSAFVPLAEKLSIRLRQRLPKVKILWGGVHPWFTPEESLELADVICIGEGEDAMLEFAADPTRTDIQNLWFKVDGSIIRNPKRPLVQSLDRFPMFVFGHNEYLLENNQIDLISIEQDPGFYHDGYYIASQRGCPYQCTYCSNSLKRTEYCGEAYLRRRSHEHVYRELELRIPQFNIDCLRVLDDVFLIDRKWVTKFCEEYPSRIGKPFGCYAYPIPGTEEMLEMARKAGLAYIHMGIQSASPYVMRDVFGRKYDLDRLERICHKAKDLGLQLAYDLLVFNPFESEANMRETLEFLLRLPSPAALYTFRLTFFAGMKLNTMNLPRHDDIPEKLRLFYALLYHAIRHPDITPEMVRGWADNTEFRKDPEKLAQILAMMIKDVEKIHYQELVIAQLQRDVAERESTRWFVNKVYRRARHVAGNAARAVGLKQ